jgi:acetylornithine deacetylase
MPPARLSSVDLIKRLIAFDTTSHKSNLALIDFVRGYLADHGIDSQLFEDETGQKANLYATVGSDDRPGIALSGHTDVVPVEGQNWSSDPFDPVERDDRIYGRGTCDMKSFIAIVLAKLPEFLDRGLDTPLHLSFSHDEEIGCAGVRSLIAGLEKMPVRPSGCIIGEPTDMKVIRGHKGKLSMECRVRGLSCHSSLVEHGVNAISWAGWPNGCAQRGPSTTATTRPIPASTPASSTAARSSTSCPKIVSSSSSSATCRTRMSTT